MITKLFAVFQFLFSFFKFFKKKDSVKELEARLENFENNITSIDKELLSKLETKLKEYNHLDEYKELINSFDNKLKEYIIAINKEIIDLKQEILDTKNKFLSSTEIQNEYNKTIADKILRDVEDKIKSNKDELISIIDTKIKDIPINNTKIEQEDSHKESGEKCICHGPNSFAHGHKCVSKGHDSIAMGKFCQAEGGQSLAIGYSAKTRIKAQFSHSSGAFAAPGDTQAAEYCLFRVTNDSNFNELFVDGSKLKLDIPKKSTMTFLIKISAYNNTLDEGFGYYFRGAVFRNSKDILQLGYLKEEYDNKNCRGYDATLEIDRENKALVIKVKGMNNSLIRWNAVVQCSEVNFAQM